MTGQEAHEAFKSYELVTICTATDRKTVRGYGKILGWTPKKRINSPCLVRLDFDASMKPMRSTLERIGSGCLDWVVPF